MVRLFISLTILLSCCSVSLAQAQSDSIWMKKVFGGYHFYQGYEKLNMNQLVKTMEPNEQAYTEIKAARSNYTLATILGASGGFMVGWPIGTALGGGDPNWILAGIGAGLIITSIPINNKFNQQARAAVDTYNNGINKSSIWDRTELRVSMTKDGLGLVLQF